MKFFLAVCFAAFSVTSAFAQQPAKTDSAKVFSLLEQKPQFPGGDTEMFRFLAYNIRYPAKAVAEGVTGLIVVSFMVDSAGTITDAKIIKSLSPETDAEALRVIGLMPIWVPAKLNGKPVSVHYNLPVRFSIDGRKGKKEKQKEKAEKKNEKSKAASPAKP